MNKRMNIGQNRAFDPEIGLAIIPKAWDYGVDIRDLVILSAAGQCQRKPPELAARGGEGGVSSGRRRLPPASIQPTVLSERLQEVGQIGLFLRTEADVEAAVVERDYAGGVRGEAVVEVWRP